ncbi:MAG TPA: GNAT family N-acetyltransferase [Candidatus Dormibacteraeota bacterium]|nr:GNAT family N-acetyltransferase [Candidatus Dormibacteraeota bacterium]
MIDLPPDAALIADTPRLRLVPAVAADAPELFHLLNDQRLHEFTGGTPLGETELTDRLRRREDRRSADGKEIVLDWVVRLVPLGEAIGMVSATVTDVGDAELSWTIGRGWQAHGFGIEASGAMVRLLEAHAGVCVLRAAISARHVAARRIATRLGMQPTGARHGRLDVWEGEAYPVTEGVTAAARAAATPGGRRRR